MQTAFSMHKKSQRENTLSIFYFLHQVVVEDAAPLFHTSTLAPLLETSASMVEAHANKKGLTIVGYYQVMKARISTRKFPMLTDTSREPFSRYATAVMTVLLL